MIKLISGEQRNAWLFWQKRLALKPPIWAFSFFMKLMDVPGIINWEGERGRAEFSASPPL